MCLIKNIENIVCLKRFVRIMNVIKKDNDTYCYSFLISGKRNININFSNIENRIFKEIVKDNKTTKEISKLLNIDINIIIDFEKILIEKYNIIYANKNKIKNQKSNLFDRHDLFFDLNFEITNFTKKHNKK